VEVVFLDTRGFVDLGVVGLSAVSVNGLRCAMRCTLYEIVSSQASF